MAPAAQQNVALRFDFPVLNIFDKLYGTGLVVVVPGFLLLRVHAHPFRHFPVILSMQGFGFRAGKHFLDVFGDHLLDQVFVRPYVEMVEQGLFRHFQEFRAVCKIVFQIGGRVNGIRILFGAAQILNGGAPATVGCLVAHDEHEGFVLVPLVQPFEAFLRNQFRGIAGLRFHHAFAVLAGSDEIRIEIVALAGENFPVIESGGVGFIFGRISLGARRNGFQVPLADNGRLVTGLLEHFRESGLGTVKGSRMFVEEVPVHVGMAASVNTGPRRSAQGVGAVAPVKDHAFVRQFAEVRIRHGRILFTGAQGLVGMVVGDNDHDVGALVRRLLLRLVRGSGQGTGRKHQGGGGMTVHC